MEGGFTNTNSGPTVDPKLQEEPYVRSADPETCYLGTK